MEDKIWLGLSSLAWVLHLRHAIGVWLDWWFYNKGKDHLVGLYTMHSMVQQTVLLCISSVMVSVGAQSVFGIRKDLVAWDLLPLSVLIAVLSVLGNYFRERMTTYVKEQNGYKGN